MANLRGFDASVVEPTKSLDPLPNGKYVAALIDSEERPTKAGTGSFLMLTFEILDGGHKGRRVWARLNLNNPSAKAVEMAQAELSAICRAVGVLSPNDSVDLHNLPMIIDVRCRKRADTGELSNEIVAYEPRPTAAAPAPATPATPATAPPWKRS